MKKQIITLCLGLIGGLISVLTINLISKNFSAHTLIKQQNIELPTSFTSYNKSSAELPDFVMAAEKSIHSVVHISTKREVKQRLKYAPL